VIGYDSLNRITGAEAGLGPYQGLQMSWSYDSFGNRLTQTGNGGMNIWTQSGNDANGNPHNQVTGTNARGVSWTPDYDAAGNMLDDGANQYLYDADGHVCAVRNLTYGGMTGYLYNASGQRVAKGTITSLSCDTTANGFTLTNQYILGPNGEQMTEMAVSGGTSTWLHTNAYANGVIATYLNDDVSPHFRFTDWLGTTRAQTDNAGTLELTCQNLPFGDTSAQCAPATEQFYTGYERDTESGNDYAQARYYASSMGRFISPDDASDQNPSNPQSWNLYSYVRNNPVIHTDPDGHSVNVCDTYGNCNVVSNQEYTAAQGSDPYNSAPTLDEVGMSGNGAGQFSSVSIFSDSGIVGSATYVSDGPTDYYANSAGLDKTVPASNVVTTMFGYWSAIFAPMMPELLLGTVPEVGLGVGGVGLSMRSTGPGPSNMREQMAIQQVKANPQAGDMIPLKGGMKDPYWQAKDGWVKMEQSVNTGSGKPVEVHYVMNTRTGAAADFKISK
jgi:RHS repeat-associated protein